MKEERNGICMDGASSKESHKNKSLLLHLPQEQDGCNLCGTVSGFLLGRKGF